MTKLLMIFFMVMAILYISRTVFKIWKTFKRNEQYKSGWIEELLAYVSISYLIMLIFV